MVMFIGKSVLITGGAGFIGSHFCQYFCLRSSVNVVILDKLTYAASLANIAAVLAHPQVKFVKGDIGDEALINTLFKKYNFDCIINFAAESHVDRSILGPSEFIETNVKGTLNLLQQALTAWQGKMEHCLFLQISTDEVFGTLTAEQDPFCETNPYQPNSPYAASKAAADHLVRAWFHTYGLPTIVTNCSNNYGPWQFPEKLIPLMIINAIEKKPLPVYGDGLQRRDWLHVTDHCSAIYTIMHHGAVGQNYCIGGNNERSNLDIIGKIGQIVDRQLNRPEGSTNQLITHVTDRPGHDRRYAINADKLKEQLGWQPSIDFEQAIEEIVIWYIQNPLWIQNIRSGDYLHYYQQQYQHRVNHP